MLQNEDINLILISAAINNDTDILHSLLESGSDVDTKDNSNYTALMWAAILGHIDTVKLLLDNGADVNIKNDKNHTAQALAKESGFFEIAALLKRSVVTR